MIPINLPIAFKSDGCTMCGICKKLLGADRYHVYCREHDFLRRYAVIHWLKANWLLARRIWAHGLIGKLRAPIYFLATTISYPLYSGTKELPAEWQEYSDYYRN